MELQPMTTDDEIDAAVDALLTYAVEGCCRNAEWRWHVCSYHEGFGDGLEAMARWLRETYDQRVDG